MTETIRSPAKPNVEKNIFKLALCGGLEDRFTAAWGHLLDREPALAQAVADTLMKDKGLTAKVKGVTDHPTLNSRKMPDFRIECEGVTILVEHKVDALLQQNQLANYLKLCDANTYVAFIAPAYLQVPPEVLIEAQYLKPEGRHHFKWSDFYDAVISQPGWRAQEFAAYMSSLGMAPFTLKGPEDIFAQGAIPVQFSEALRLAAEQVYGNGHPGCVLKRSPTHLGLEVRAPSEGLTLIYIWAEQRSSYVHDFDGPVLAVNVFERVVTANEPLEDVTTRTLSGLTVRRHRLAKSLTLGESQCRVTYVAPLVEVIQETREATVKSMVEMLKVVRADFWPKELQPTTCPTE